MGPGRRLDCKEGTASLPQVLTRDGPLQLKIHLREPSKGYSCQPSATRSPTAFTGHSASALPAVMHPGAAVSLGEEALSPLAIRVLWPLWVFFMSRPELAYIVCTSCCGGERALLPLPYPQQEAALRVHPARTDVLPCTWKKT